MGIQDDIAKKFNTYTGALTAAVTQLAGTSEQASQLVAAYKTAAKSELDAGIAEAMETGNVNAIAVSDFKQWFANTYPTPDENVKKAGAEAEAYLKKDSQVQAGIREFTQDSNRVIGAARRQANDAFAQIGDFFKNNGIASALAALVGIIGFAAKGLESTASTLMIAAAAVVTFVAASAFAETDGSFKWLGDKILGKTPEHTGPAAAPQKSEFVEQAGPPDPEKVKEITDLETSGKPKTETNLNGNTLTITTKMAVKGVLVTQTEELALGAIEGDKQKATNTTTITIENARQVFDRNTLEKKEVTVPVDSTGKIDIAKVVDAAQNLDPIKDIKGYIAERRTKNPDTFPRESTPTDPAVPRATTRTPATPDAKTP